MKYKHPALTLGAIISCLVILFTACKKINATTEIGGDLIPAVDNIHTFDTTLNVEIYNDLFTLATDSSRGISSDEQFLGLINNDPLFGKTDARMFLELKPGFYKYSFQNKPDSLHLDSVVLVLDYAETYGDTTVPQTVNVYEMDQSNEFRFDSSYLLRQNSFTYSNLLGSRTFTPSSLNDSIKAYQDTTANQLRIRLSDAFGNRLLQYDTVGTTGGYSSDSSFKTKFKGFALQSVGSGNALMGFSLSGFNTKLAIYYHYDKNAVLNADTTVAYFTFTGLSAAANYIGRDYSGFPIAGVQGGTTPDALAYIQTTPGSLATIKIPGLAGLSNRIVHRAELIADEAYDVSDTLFPPPNFLFLDAYEPTLAKYMTIPYDVFYDPSALSFSNLDAFGVAPLYATDGAGHGIHSWHFNVTRYVQHVANGTEAAYDLRLAAPFYTYEQYRAAPGIPASTLYLPLNPAPAKGRVRLQGGDASGLNPHRMRLHIIYSKI